MLKSRQENQVLAIECVDVKRTYKSRTKAVIKKEIVALNGLNLSIPQGVVYGLLGPNGSGKTTTIRILSTLLTPTSGHANILGYDVVRDLAQIRKHIGLILGGDRGLYGRLNGSQNLKYFAALNLMNRAVTLQRVKEVLELVHLTQAANQPVEQYSRGMKQRLHIARGLLTNPELLFMDEPTIGLDPQGAQELRQMVPELKRSGKTILLTTHYMLEADQLCDNITIINKGQVVAAGTPSDIKRKFSKIQVLEALVRNAVPALPGELAKIKGLKRVVSNPDGPITRFVLHVEQGINVKQVTIAIIGENNIESFVEREPTLEEAYLSIIT